ncbi:MAG: GNAT family N-acetyltransferase [Burkholderiales bacterium]
MPKLRLGAPGDIDFVVSQVAEGARHGKFSPTYLKKETQQHFAHALSRVCKHGDLSRGTYRGIETVPAELWVCEREHQALGFLLIAGLDNQGGPDRELYMIGVRADARGQGLGRALTDFFRERFAGRTLHAQCRPESERMHAMLLRRGFVHIGNTVGGYRVLRFQA